MGNKLHEYIYTIQFDFTFRWVSIIRRMNDFEDSEKREPSESVPKPNDFEEQKLHIKRW